eukprot:scaffold11.g4042.t1
MDPLPPPDAQTWALLEALPEHLRHRILSFADALERLEHLGREPTPLAEAVAALQAVSLLSGAHRLAAAAAPPHILFGMAGLPSVAKAEEAWWRDNTPGICDRYQQRKEAIFCRALCWTVARQPLEGGGMAGRSEAPCMASELDLALLPPHIRSVRLDGYCSNDEEAQRLLLRPPLQLASLHLTARGGRLRVDLERLLHAADAVTLESGHTMWLGVPTPAGQEPLDSLARSILRVFAESGARQLVVRGGWHSLEPAAEDGSYSPWGRFVVVEAEPARQHIGAPPAAPAEAAAQQTGAPPVLLMTAGPQQGEAPQAPPAETEPQEADAPTAAPANVKQGAAHPAAMGQAGPQEGVPPEESAEQGPAPPSGALDLGSIEEDGAAPMTTAQVAAAEQGDELATVPSQAAEQGAGPSSAVACMGQQGLSTDQHAVAAGPLDQAGAQQGDPSPAAPAVGPAAQRGGALPEALAAAEAEALQEYAPAQAPPTGPLQQDAPLPLPSRAGEEQGCVLPAAAAESGDPISSTALAQARAQQGDVQPLAAAQVPSQLALPLALRLAVPLALALAPALAQALPAGTQLSGSLALPVEAAAQQGTTPPPPSALAGTASPAMPAKESAQQCAASAGTLALDCGQRDGAAPVAAAQAATEQGDELAAAPSQAARQGTGLTSALACTGQQGPAVGQHAVAAGPLAQAGAQQGDPPATAPAVGSAAQRGGALPEAPAAAEAEAQQEYAPAQASPTGPQQQDVTLQLLARAGAEQSCVLPAAPVEAAAPISAQPAALAQAQQGSVPLWALAGAALGAGFALRVALRHILGRCSPERRVV